MTKGKSSDTSPKYPIYVPSKNRANACYTAKFFLEDGVDFKLVVEPEQEQAYREVFPPELLLILPENNMRLLGTRLWIREHSIENGHARHWQFDDNIRYIGRLNHGERIRCNANVAIKAIEDFTDRYTNIGISGFNYYMFATRETKKPFVLNCHVYSACLINNRMPYKWRLYYNDDTDLCLQVLTNGLCTVLFNAFLVQKIRTMVVKGGNSDDLYHGKGRLQMARTLEEVWPQHVETKWRFGRPQHVIKNAWKDFTTPLIRRKDIDWEALPKVENYGLELRAVKPVKSRRLKKLIDHVGTGKK